MTTEKRSKKGNLGKVLGASAGSLITLVIVAGAIAYSVSGTLQGKIKVWFWSGNDTLRCSDDQVIVIKGKTASTGSQVIYAGGNCQVTLEKVDFTGDTGIYLSGNASLTVRDSKIKGQQSHGIYAGSSGKVVLQNTTVEGKSDGIYVGSGAHLELTGGSVVGGQRGLYLGSDGVVILKDVTVKGERDGVYVGSKSEVTATGGSIVAGKQALYAGSRSKITLKGTKTVGKVYIAKDAQVSGLKLGVEKITDTIQCKGNAEMTIEGKKVRLRKLIVDASEHCKLKLVNCEFEGRPAAVQARDHAQVQLIGGRYKGRTHSLLAHNYAIILVSKETKLAQKIGVSSDLAVVSRPGIDVKAVADHLAQFAAKEKRYKKGACDGFLQCYKEKGSGGRFDAWVEMTPDAKGRITKVKFKKLVASKRRAVKKCLEAEAKEKKIEGYEGPPGTLWCHTWGQLSGFMEAVSSNSGFTFDKIPKPTGLKPIDLPDVK